MYKNMCSECNGSGQYIGLNIIETCSKCNGSGQRPISDAMDFYINNLPDEKLSTLITACQVLYDGVDYRDESK